MTTKREMALLFAGAFISAAAGLFGSSGGINWASATGLGIAGGVCLIYGFLGPGIGRWLNYEYRKRCCPIGILNDMDWDSEYGQYSSWTDVSPQEWKERIEKTARWAGSGVRIHLIKRDAIFDRYTAIVNPYGGVYPESDLKTQATMRKIIEYVANGGLFVSVADIPGFYGYDPRLRGRIDITPANWQIGVTPQGGVGGVAIRLYERTPLMETLGLRALGLSGQTTKHDEQPFKWGVERGSILGEAVEDIGDIAVDRVVVVERNVQAVIRPAKHNGADVTPFFVVPYGNGRLLMSLAFLSRPQNQGMKDAIAKAVVQLTTEGRVGRGTR